MRQYEPMATSLDTPPEPLGAGRSERLPLATILTYSAPALGTGFMFLLLLIYRLTEREHARIRSALSRRASETRGPPA